MKPFSYLLIFCLTLCLSRPGWAQDLARLDQLLTQQDQAATTLLAQPKERRRAMLEAALYPDTLQELARRQKQTGEQFQRLISPYPRGTQEKIYNLVRYPELLEDLVAGGEKSKGQIQELTSGMPKEVREAARDLAKNHYPLLRDIQALYAASNLALENLLTALPSSSQAAYRTLLGYPEVLETLSLNPDLTTALGQAYRTDPDATFAKLEGWSTDAGRQNAAALEDYRHTLQQDPKARAELQSSAQEFARQYNYPSYDETAPPAYGYEGTNYATLNSYSFANVNPYPYWFGYPSWYGAPLWRPYPLWYQTGYYNGFGNNFFVVSLPSLFYTNWFYRSPRNFYRYPYLASCYGNYYYRWRSAPVYGGFYQGARNWHYRYRDRISDDLYYHDRYRADRWRDYGHWEERQRKRPSYRNPAFHPSDWRERQGYRARNWDRESWKSRHPVPLDKTPKFRPPDTAGKFPRHGDRDRPKWRDNHPDNHREAVKKKAPTYGKPPLGTQPRTVWRDGRPDKDRDHSRHRERSQVKDRHPDTPKTPATWRQAKPDSNSERSRETITRLKKPEGNTDRPAMRARTPGQGKPDVGAFQHREIKRDRHESPGFQKKREPQGISHRQESVDRRRSTPSSNRSSFNRESFSGNRSTPASIRPARSSGFERSSRFRGVSQSGWGRSRR